MLPHPLTNFEIQKYYEMNQNLMVFFQEFIGNKNIKANIFRVQAKNSVICGYFCIGFIDFMLAG